MPLNRTIPASGISHDSRWFARVLDATQKVAVYFPGDTPDAVSLVGYYDTVSAANTAATANAKANGARPRVAINWWHSDFDSRQCGPIRHRKSEEDLPAWLDAIPAS